MLHPSYTDLMQVVNKEVEPGEEPVKYMRIFLPDIDTVPTAATGNTAQAHSFSLISTSYAEKRAVKTVPFRDQFSLSSEIILTFEL